MLQTSTSTTLTGTTPITGTTTGTTTINSDPYSKTLTLDSTGNWYAAISDVIPRTILNVNDTNDVIVEGKPLKEFLKDFYNKFLNQNNDKEKNEMFENFNFEFGPVKNGRIVMSPYGPAVKAKNVNPSTYYTYDVKGGRLMDVKDCVFNFDTDLFWKIPVAPTALKPGDIIIQNNELYFITALVTDSDCPNIIQGVNVASAKIENILPVCNMFNFNFVIKVVPLFNMFGAEGATPFTAPSEDQPFGNLAPLMMMDMFKGDGGKDFSELMKTMMMFSMFNGNNPFCQMFGGNG